MAEGNIWYHGGSAGREAGHMILQPSATGVSARRTASCAGRDRADDTYFAGGADFFVQWSESLGQESRVHVVAPQG